MLEGWRECALGDVLEFKRGYDLPHARRRPGAVPIISSSGVTGYHDEAKVAGPGVVTGRYGTLGEAFYIESDFWPLNTSLYVRDFKGNDPRFVSYLIGSLNLGAGNSAGAVPGLNRNHLHQLRTRIPPLATQRHIAAILSAYDDLIEVNTRRIAILEEMAQRVYEEWFVRYRSPGGTGEKPDDWSWSSFGSLAEFINGFAFKPADFHVEGLPIVKIPELKNGVTSKTPFNDGQAVPAKYHIENGDLLFSWSGTLAINVWTSGPALLNQHLFRVLPKGSIGRGFLLFALRRSVDEMMSHAVGATMKHIRRGTLDQVGVHLPDAEAMSAPNDYFEGVYSALGNLIRQNANLRAQRDLLLPRLVSGRLSVDEAERQVEETAA